MLVTLDDPKGPELTLSCPSYVLLKTIELQVHEVARDSRVSTRN